MTFPGEPSPVLFTLLPGPDRKRLLRSLTEEYANLRAAMAETADLRASYAVTGAPMEYSPEQKERLRK